ncbi:MAG: S-layer homology domain-containing protein, partial [Firmicutes bacterium]|nr:S-layer homology domain-containing protein [Bacillota bacterium]
KVFYAKWEEDANGDNIADDSQVLVYFVSADDAEGTVSGTTCKVYTAGNVSVDLSGVTVSAKSNYVFDYWKLDGAKAALPGSFSFENGKSYTFTAYWAVDNWSDARDSLSGGDNIADYKQAVVQFGAEPGGSVSGKTTQVFTLSKVGNSYAGYVRPAAVTVSADSGYAFLNWVRGGSAADPYAEGGIWMRGGSTVTYNARFSADNSGDGVPDIRQIFVHFLSADEDEGTVSGSGAEQVFLLPDGATTMDITPSLDDVDVEGETYSRDNIRFEFDYWTMDDGRTAVDPEDTLYGIAGNTTIIFWAHFEEELIETRGTVVLTKVDADDEDTVLSGVVFELYDDDDDLIGTYTTDEDGEIKVRRLEEGDYYFVEVRPAAGYLLNDEEHEFSIEPAEVTKLTVENVRSSVPAGFSNEHYAYIVGYTDRTVQPEANITRAEVATIFFRLLDEETRDEYLTRRNAFSDVAADKWYNTAVSTMASMGIIVGYEDGTFRPDEQITRAEFAAIAARFDDSGYRGEASFTDIYGHWAYREINIAAHNGWILGYTDGTFMPDQAITRAEAMAMVNRVLQRIPENTSDLRRGMIQWIDNQDTGKWYYLTVQEATNSHEYACKSNGYEYWTKLTSPPDWAALEQ